MTRLVSVINPALALTFVILTAFVSAPVQAQPSSDKAEKRLREKLTKAQASLDKALKLLDKKKQACRQEYGLIKNKATKETLAGLLDAVRTKYIEEVGNVGPEKVAKKLKKEMTKDVRGILANTLGNHLAGYLAMPLRDEMLDRIGAADYSSLKVVTDLFSDAFTGNFEDDFRTDIRGTLSKRLDKLKANKESLQRELDQLMRTKAARKSGLPSGMVRVEGGDHLIGIDKKELKAFCKSIGTPLEKLSMCLRSYPMQTKKLAPFLIDTNEVTNEAWREFLKDTGKKSHPKHWIKGQMPQGFEKRPVTYISYNAARAFCTWVGRRLPTEFEWEAAARHGRSKKTLNWYAWGDEIPGSDKKDRCNFNALTGDPRRPKPIKGVKYLPPVFVVGSCADGPNQSLSLFDMCGNAAEFTSSPFHWYPGFENQKVGRTNVTKTDFDRNKIVIRGGHGLNRGEVVTTFWRLGLEPGKVASTVGFRTAATPIKGKDHLDALLGEGDYDRYLVDYPLLDSDLNANPPRKRPALALDDPSRYTALMAGGWNSETGLPTRARYISIVNRKANDFRTVDSLSGYVSKDGTPVLIGFLHLDVAVEEPKLAPSNYLVLWRGAHEEIVEPEETPTEEGEAEKEKEKGKGKGKSKGKGKGKGKGKKEDKPVETISVPDQILFYDVSKSKEEIVALDMQFHKPIQSTAQPTAIRQSGKDGSGVELVFSFPIKYKNAKAFVVVIPLKTKPGVTSEYK